MNWVDLAFLLLAAFSILMGAWRGLVFELISLLGWFLGFWLAMHFGESVGQLLPLNTLSDVPKYVLGAILVFVLAMFVSSFMASAGRRFTKALGMRAADRLTGAGFGLVRALLLGVVVAVLVNALQLQKEPWWMEARMSGVLDTIRLELVQWLPDWAILQPSAKPLIDLPAVVEQRMLPMQ